MSKNIVICLDGTGNQIEENISNVLKLYRSLKKNGPQVSYYDQGVGTLGRTDTWGLLKQKLNSAILGMGFGLGLDDNVIRAYEFLVRTYEEDDQIFIFGFSRGAHTGRVLAGMIYEVGILKPSQVHLSGAALTAYKQAKPIRGSKVVASEIFSEDISEDEFQEAKDKVEQIYEGSGANFRRVMSTRNASIKFLGLWDTVSSVIVPNYPKLFFPPFTKEVLPHTSNNPAVEYFRQAASIDEKRRMFRLDEWDPGQHHKPEFYAKDPVPPQNVKQVWFAGCHSDVGGGYKKDDSGLSQFPLIWMIEEAKDSGLLIFDRMADYVTGVIPYSDRTKYIYPEPDETACEHKSLKGVWWVLEIIPKCKKFREWLGRRTIFNLYLPLGEPRNIPDDAAIHTSVWTRIEHVPMYKPVNLPPRKTV